MIIAGQMRPLWQAPILPLLFLLSAIAVGLPMVIVGRCAADRSASPECRCCRSWGGW
jgi:formate-dependent nitrite reductase membrane component NrfD